MALMPHERPGIGRGTRAIPVRQAAGNLEAASGSCPRHRFTTKHAAQFGSCARSKLLAADDAVEIFPRDADRRCNAVDGRCPAAVSVCGWRVADDAKAADDFFVGEHGERLVTRVRGVARENAKF